MPGQGTERKNKSAASTRAHTIDTQQRSSSGFLKTILLVSFVGALAWVYQSIQPPPPKIVGSPGGIAVTSPRIKLRDGRHLAYKEFGFPRDEAMFKIIYIHGFDSSMRDSPIAHFLSPALVDDLRIYTVSFDRPGYGESDPDPARSPKSIALDIEELADGLGLGPKFYVFGLSMGGEITRIWAYSRQQGEYESIHQDLNVGFSSWEFNPLDLQDPFLNNNGSVHVWQGDEDKLVPVKLQRYIMLKLPWIRYHEISGSGHLLPFVEGMTDKIIKSLLVGEEEASKK